MDGFVSPDAPEAPDTLTAEQAQQTVDEYIVSQEDKSLLRFITCGSVDDGKSTLIGRLLYEAKLLFDDQITALEADSKKVGTQGADIDFALLVDGLASEREQGITIDVAYRFFATDARKYIVIDTPGHEQYTRNMATGASQAELAVLLIDARHGLSTQTRRHSFIMHSLGVRKLVLAINKMDLIDDKEARFNEIVSDYRAFADELGIEDFTAIPVSALKGDNIVDQSADMPWYKGPTLMQHLDSVPVGDAQETAPFHMSVQWVNRPNLDFRGFSGRIASGTVRPGDELVSLPSGVSSTVSRIYTMDGDREVGLPNESVTICLEDEIDVSRGSVLADAENPPKQDDRFETTILWMSETPLSTNQTYVLKLGTQEVSASVLEPDYLIDVNTLAHVQQDSMSLNAIGISTVTTDKPLIYTPYSKSRHLGGFILIDRMSNETVGLGLIRRAASGTKIPLRTQTLLVNREARARLMDQKPFTVWFTGIKRGGKTYIANRLEQRLHAQGYKTFILDAENVWKGLSEDLDFMGADRVENTRRVAEVARLMNDAGVITFTCFSSPFSVEREQAKRIIGEENIIEVHVNTPLDIAEAGDRDGFFQKARDGEISNVAGIDVDYECPECADLTVGLHTHSIEAATDAVYDLLKERQLL
jgi:bifunctional enzyme CysN/CysC